MLCTKHSSLSLFGPIDDLPYARSRFIYLFNINIVQEYTKKEEGKEKFKSQ